MGNRVFVDEDGNVSITVEDVALRVATAALVEDNARLRCEAKQLRELVADMMRFFEDGDYCTICEKVSECESHDEYESDCLMRGVFRSRMSELGVGDE